MLQGRCHLRDTKVLAAFSNFAVGECLKLLVVFHEFPVRFTGCQSVEFWLVDIFVSWGSAEVIAVIVKRVTSAHDDAQVGLEHLLGDLAKSVAIRVVSCESSRGCMRERNGRNDTSGLALLDSHLREVFHGVSIVGHTQHAVFYLGASSHRGTCSGRVSDDAFLHVLVAGPSLFWVVGTTHGVGGLRQAVEVFIRLNGVALLFLNVFRTELAVNQVLGLSGFVEVVISNVVVAHAITNHVDDVFRAVGFLGRDRSNNSCRNSQTSSDCESAVKTTH